MQTRLPESLLSTSQGQLANRILRNCVHCGFCTATCPTYQLLGDELDGPRGRIYLVKEMLEGRPVTHHTQQHLDRCLTCRACETTCPSGVEYGRLIDIGRLWIENRVRRPLPVRIQRFLLRTIVPYRRRFRPLLRLGKLVKPLLPSSLQNRIPTLVNTQVWPQRLHSRRMLLPDNCVQGLTHPHIDSAAARVLDHFQVTLMRAGNGGCCGALSQHLAAGEEARQQMRRNIDSWWPLLNDGVEAIVVTASGCAAHLKEYRHFFEDDPLYRDKARRVSERVRDLSEVITTLPLQASSSNTSLLRIAFQSPCTLQHGQQINDLVEPLLRQCGYLVETPVDAHLCCGSAGTYSILQPVLAERLLDDKLSKLQQLEPDCIATANIGCLMHLQTRAARPVLHWIELIDRALQQ